MSLYPLISGIAWFWAGCGAVVIAALAGLATRLQPLPAAGVAASLALIAAFPLLASPHPYLGVTGLVIVAAAAASVTGWGLLPAAATLITYLASQLIYINLLFAPGASNGGVIPTMASLRRLGTPADIASAVCFLASDEASYITGHVLAVNVGMYT